MRLRRKQGAQARRPRASQGQGGVPGFRGGFPQLACSSRCSPASSGEGPFGGSGATGVWRSFLTDEYSKSFAKAGGIGIADTIYRELIARQGKTE